MVRVAGLRPDQVNQFHSLGLDGLRHDVGGLLLGVVFAAVGDRRQVEEIQRVVSAVIHVPQFLFVLPDDHFFILEHAKKLGRLGEAGPGRRGTEETRVMHGKLPGGGPAHREAPHHQAVGIDAVVLANGIQRLEAVDFAGELVGAAITSIQMQDDRVWRRELPGAAETTLHKGEFAQGFSPAVTPEIKPVLFGSLEVVARGDHQAVRLDRAIDLGKVATDDLTGLAQPGRLALFERLGPGDAEFDLLERSRHLRLGVVDFVITQGIMHRLVKHDDVGKQRQQFRFVLEVFL